MKTAAEIANHPKARLQRELVRIIRAQGNIAVAIVAWREIRSNAALWRRVVTYGLDEPHRQLQLNRVAFPDHNHAEVDAALQAGNHLRTLYELACGHAWVARESDGNFKQGRKGLRVMRTIRSVGARRLT